LLVVLCEKFLYDFCPLVTAFFLLYVTNLVGSIAYSEYNQHARTNRT